MSHVHHHVVSCPRRSSSRRTSRVELQFTEIASDYKVDFRVEYGKTRIG